MSGDDGGEDTACVPGFRLPMGEECRGMRLRLSFSVVYSYKSDPTRSFLMAGVYC